MGDLIDAAARETGIDRIELRRRNFVAPAAMPYKTATGSNYDSGEFAAVLQKALAAADWTGFAARKAAAKKRGKLYGRGGADDGYAVYASIAAGQALKAQKTPHPRIVGLIATCEESGSYDLLPYVDALRPRLGDVALVICLDSGAGNYDQLWLTTSLRGMASGTLKVEILTEGIHSGDASGVVPSSFRIMRQVLDRLEDSKTGRMLPASFHCDVPADRLVQTQATAAILGDATYSRFPWAHHDCGGSSLVALPTTTDPVQALLKRTWEPTLSVTGAEGFPTLQNAGNVLRPTPRSSSACVCPPWWMPQPACRK